MFYLNLKKKDVKHTTLPEIKREDVLLCSANGANISFLMTLDEAKLGLEKPEELTFIAPSVKAFL
jgi:hypothetical protein